MAFTTHSHLAPRLRKRVGLYLFVACSRVNFTITFITGSLVDKPATELLRGTVPLLEFTAHIALSYRLHTLRYAYTSTFDGAPSSAPKLIIAAFQPGHRAELSGLPRRHTDGSRMDVGGAAVRRTHGIRGLFVRD